MAAAWVVLAAACSTEPDRGRADPSAALTVPLPPPPPKDAAPPGGDYLSGDADLVARFRSLSEPLLTLGTISADAERRRTCRDIVERLGAEVPPDALLEAALAIADPTLSELAVSDRTARSDLLVACLEGNRSRTEAGVAQVTAIDVLFKRRLGEL